MRRHTYLVFRSLRFQYATKMSPPTAMPTHIVGYDVPTRQFARSFFPVMEGVDAHLYVASTHRHLHLHLTSRGPEVNAGRLLLPNSGNLSSTSTSHFPLALFTLLIPQTTIFFSPLHSASSFSKVPLCLSSSHKNLLSILFVPCKLTWFPTSLSVSTFTHKLQCLCSLLLF